MAKSPLLLPIADPLIWQQDTLFPTAQQTAADLLWLAIHFPKLAVELAPHGADNAILVAVEQAQGRTQIHTASTLAEDRGIFAGMPVNAAYSLCPAIEVVRYEPERQYECLRQIAIWAGQFTSQVSVYDASTLLLEVLGSVRLFGGMRELLQIIRERLNWQWPYLANFAVSPTPAASALLASTAVGTKKNGAEITPVEEIVEDIEALRSRLGAIRLSRLPLSKKTNKQLHRLGLQSVRDLLRLPKADVARRYGKDVTLYLDRLLGVVPEPQHFQKQAEVFRAAWPLAFETKDSQIISRVVARLLQRLQVFLQQRDACVRAYDVYFEHLKKTPSILQVHFRQANRDGQRLLLLFEERLRQFQIDSAVTGIQLFADRLEKFTASNETLAFAPEFQNSAVPAGAARGGNTGGDDEHINNFLDLLQARIGEGLITTLHARADHRPDYAYYLTYPVTHRMANAGGVTGDITPHDRPLWLLSAPRMLRNDNGKVYYHDALALVAGPERIESGWWSLDDMRRDYYVATTGQGQRLWIFQELCQPYRWYVHGFFA